MKFGIAKEMITPYFKTTMIGFGSCFGKEFDEVHDDLYVKTIIIEDNKEEKILLISVDLLFHDFSLTEQIQEFVVRNFEIPGENVFLVYTHTHYAPSAKGYDLWNYSEEFERFLFERITQCIYKASINTYEGNVQYGIVEGDWNISRRKIVDGKCIFAPNPAGDKENLLNIFKLVDKAGNIKAMLLNYPCHPSSMSAKLSLSAEYPGRLCNLIESRNYGCTAIFFQGAGADSKLRCSVKADRFAAATYDDINEAATGMADRVQKALAAGSFDTLQIDLAAKQFIMPLPLNVYPKSYFEEQAEKWDKDPYYDLLAYCARHVIKNYDSMPDEIGLHGGVIKINENMVIFTMGGEPSFDVKAVLQKAFPEKKVIFFGYSDSIAYIPSDKIINEGGYEAEGSVTEYKLKGSIKSGVNEIYAKYYNEAMINVTRAKNNRLL